MLFEAVAAGAILASFWIMGMSGEKLNRYVEDLFDVSKSAVLDQRWLLEDVTLYYDVVESIA